MDLLPHNFYIAIFKGLRAIEPIKKDYIKQEPNTQGLLSIQTEANIYFSRLWIQFHMM
jgi:hypothetical protein